MNRKLEPLIRLNRENDARKKGLLLLTVCCSLTFAGPCGTGMVMAAETVPSYVKTPNAGQYTIGSDAPATNQNGHQEAGTDFYIRIEKPRQEKYVRSSGGGDDDDDDDDGGGTASAEAQSFTYKNLPLGNDGVGDELGGLLDDLPKTGDYGPDKTLLLELALIFGTGYLVCDHMEKRQEHAICEGGQRDSR